MKLIAACIVSFLITLVTGRFLLPELRRLKAGQSIREDGPTWHAGKSGTPTMGGLMFIFGILVTILVFGWDAMCAGSFAHLYVFAFAAVFGLIGFLDDFQKVKMHRNLGLTAIQKFALQLAAAVVFLCLMRYEGMLTPNLYVPFANTYVILPWIVYMIFAAFVIVGTVNAVNITDGIDGLAGSVTVPVALFFAVVGSWWGYENDLGVFAAAMVGGLIGFLVYNFHPAKVFMGDTGSTFLGYILATYSIQGLFKYYAIVSFAVPFLVLGLPIFDTAFAIVRRVARGQSPMTPDRGHIHHRMMDMGLNQKQTVAALYVVSSLLGLSAVVLTTSGELKAMLLLLTLAAVAYVASRVIFPREIAETAHEKELEQEEMQAKSAAPAPEEKEEKHEEN